LPAQGLVDEARHGVALRDLHGRRLIWLRDFAVYPPGDQSPTSAFLAVPLPEPIMRGPNGWYRLDAVRHALIPIRDRRLPLAGGADVLASPQLRFAVERRARVVLRGSSATFRIVSSRLVQSGTTLLDVSTGRRWKLPPGCTAGGLQGPAVILACGVAPGAERIAPLRLERFVPGAGLEPLTPPLAQLVPERLELSPDGMWIAAEGFTGCAASFVYLASAAGGSARLVYGRSLTEPYTSNYSSLLGWTRDDRVVVQFTPPHCDEPYGSQPPPNGVYLVDPHTRARTFVTQNAVAMWGNAAA
jgi:hypothetical protein